MVQQIMWAVVYYDVETLVIRLQHSHMVIGIYLSDIWTVINAHCESHRHDVQKS